MNLDGPKESAYAAAFVSYTVFGIVDVWFKRGMRETPGEIAALAPR